MSHVVTLTDANFREEVDHFTGLVMVDFGAPWCPPCRMMAPAIEQLATEYEGAVKTATLDTDDNPETVARFGVRGLPTFLFFRDGKLVDSMVGAVGKARLQQTLDTLGARHTVAHHG